MDLVFNWPQITVLILVFLGIVSRIVKFARSYGDDLAEVVGRSFGIAAYAFLWPWLLYMGGFFSN